MKKIIMSLIVIFLVGSLSACGMRMDGKNLNSSKKEETETRVSNELEKALPTEVEESESESTVFETEEATSEGNYPGADVVEIVNLRGDETTVYKLVDGTYMDLINRRFTYNGTDIWTDENGVEWNEVVKTSTNDNSSINVIEASEDAGWKESPKVTSGGDYPGADVVEIVNLRGDETTVYKLADGTYMDRINRRFTYNGTDTWTDENGVEWNEAVKTSANDDSSNSVNGVPEDESWKAALEKSLFENYGVVPKYYEELGDGIYQVYVEVGGEVVPLVTVDSATGEYQVNW